jgi:hypothetical protein
MVDSGRAAEHSENGRRGDEPLSPAWRAFIRYCRDLRHGEIERLSIQDGVPVLAEVTKRKVKFNGLS